MRYEFCVPGLVVVGPGTSAELPERLAFYGTRALLVESHGAAGRAGPAAQLADRLQASGQVGVRVRVAGEPTIESVEQVRAQAHAAQCDHVVAIGGGSVIDTGKAAAALLTNPGAALDYLEVVGAGRALVTPALPIVAVPTTAGAGSEATRNAVLRSGAHGAKASLRDPSLMPRLALVDATLCRDLPRAASASGGMDALTQLIEAFVSRRAGPLTDGLCREGIRLAAGALRRVCDQPEDEPARTAMSAAALLSGMALANAGLGAVHGIAAPLGGALDAPHGALCAALLAPVTAANIRALERSERGSGTLGRYAEIARVLGAGDTADALPAWLAGLARDLAIPGLHSYGLSSAMIAELAERALHASSTRSNPVELTASELGEAIRMAL